MPAIRPCLVASFALISGCATSDPVAQHTPTNGEDAGVGGSSSTGGSTSPTGGSGGSIGIDAGTAKPFVGVPETCEQADGAKSYIGCEYWPTITLNSSLSKAFEFAIVAANPQKTAAHVKVEKGGQVIAEVDVAPHDVATVKLPWDDALKQTRAAPSQPLASALVKGGAFRATSDVPVVMYQFNPLEFAKGPPIPTDFPCVIDIYTGACMSWSNDASLLLPTSALRDDYFTVTRPSFHVGDEINPTFTDWWDYPSFIAITATKPNTHVNVQSSANVREGSGVVSMSANTTQAFVLNAGDVLLLAAGKLPENAPVPANQPCADIPIGPAIYHLCVATSDYDFSGSRVTADQPVSVIAGHDCTMVPHSLWACDHLEESMLPTESLGTEQVVTAPRSTNALLDLKAKDPTYVKILSAAPDNDIEFDPPSIHAPVTLGEGEFIEVGPVSEDFVVKGTNRLLVSQFFTGKNPTGMPVQGELGDPSQTLSIPTEQFRKEYTFLAPVTYTQNFVNVFTKAGTSIAVDGTSIVDSEYEPIGSSGYVVARYAVSGGAHSVSSSNGQFGIVVYGYGNFTSYAYPGGLNLEPIVIVPK